MAHDRKTRWLRYAVATIFCGLALGLSWVLKAPAACFFLAVMLSSLYGGKSPGLLSVALSAIAYDYFFLFPRFSLTIDPVSWVQFAVFLGTMLLVTGVIEAKHRAESSHKQIAARVQKNEFYLVETERLGQTGSWACTSDLQTTYFSIEMFRIFRLPMRDAPPSPNEISKLFAPGDWAQILDNFENSRRKKLAWDGEFSAALPDGSTRIIRMVVHPVLDAAGEISEFVSTCVDVTEQRRASKALERALNDAQKSEDRLRTIIDTIPALAWSAGPDGSADFFNRHYLDYVGFSEQQMQNLGWIDSVHPDDLKGLADAWQSIVTSGQPHESEARLRRSDGEYRWFLFQSNPLRDESGKIVRWYGINTDICDRKNAEEHLRSSEEKHRVIVEAANDAVVSMDDKGLILLANPATQRIFGYDPAEIIGKPLTMLMPETMRSLHVNGYTRYLTTEKRRLNWQGVEVTALRKDGQEFPVEVSFGEMTSDGHKIFTGFIRDISEKKKAEEILRASEQNLRLIVDSIPGLICIMTVAGEFDLANKQFLDYTGKSANELKTWHAVAHPDDLPLVVSRLKESLETGCQFDIEVRVRRADSEYRWFRCCGLPLRDEQGKIIRWYKLLIDIEDRKQAEEALNHSQAQLSRAIRTATVGEFAASIAHEINQPLAAVVANGHACLRWLAAQPPGFAKAQEAAERIVRDGKEAGEVVRRIRALFKHAPPETINLDLNEIIREVLRLLASEAAKKHVAMETDLTPDLERVQGDRVQLQQLLFNLLQNGIESMDTALPHPKRLVIRTRLQMREGVLVEIRDWGVGLSDSTKIFDAFFTTKDNGMGMGLAICRSIVDAHHGRIWASSAEGPGTTFSFTLPVQPVAAA